MCVCTSPFVKNSNYSLASEHIVIVDILSVCLCSLPIAQGRRGSPPDGESVRHLGHLKTDSQPFNMVAADHIY